MFQLNAPESARMFFAPLAANLDVVRGHLLALLVENGNDVGRRAAPQARDKQFEGTGSGFAAPLYIDGDGVAAGGGGDQEVVAGILNDGGGAGVMLSPIAHDTLLTSMAEILTLAQIQNARQRIAPCVRRTPLTASAVLSERLKTNVYVKLELFQKTGSFKVRGAFNKALGLTAEERGQGLVAVSGGNHAQAVAYAARTLGLKSVILMPESTPANYVDATRGYGAEIKFAANVGAAFAEVAEYERQGWAYIHPFDDPVVMAGQGTIGLEILDDVPQVTDIIVSIGGGGLIGGIATAVRSLKPSVRIWGVETEGADCMSKSLAAGKIVTLGRDHVHCAHSGRAGAFGIHLGDGARFTRKRHRGQRRRSALPRCGSCWSG